MKIKDRFLFIKRALLVVCKRDLKQVAIFQVSNDSNYHFFDESAKVALDTVYTSIALSNKEMSDDEFLKASNKVFNKINERRK